MLAPYEWPATRERERERERYASKRISLPIGKKNTIATYPRLVAD
jgi:hypothetical protein